MFIYFGLWPNEEGDELYRSHFLRVQFNADSLKLITLVVFLFRVIKNCKSALSEKMDIGLILKGLSSKELHNMVATFGEEAAPQTTTSSPR